MFKLIENRPLVPNLHELTVEAPDVARSVQPGQFVIVRAEEDGERIPLSVADWDAERHAKEGLERLRQAKDKAEFDQFMSERGRRTGMGPDVGEGVAP